VGGQSVRDTYTASDGSRWHLTWLSPPAPYRSHDWSAAHEDYDGAPDAHDDRCVYGPTREAAIAAVEVLIDEGR